MTPDEIENYYKEWEKIGIACYDCEYVDLFKQSKVLITDCGSFTTEYFCTKKPLIHLISKHFNFKIPPQTKEIFDTFYKVNEINDLYKYLDEILINNNDYMKDKRLEVLKKQNLLGTNASENVLNDINNFLGIK